MKLFKCEVGKMTFTVVDLPRRSWRVLPPKRWQVALTVAGIICAAVVFALT